MRCITPEHLGQNANTDSCSYGGHRMDAVSTIAEISPVQAADPIGEWAVVKVGWETQWNTLRGSFQ